MKKMTNKAYRHGLVRAQIEIDLPFQIRALRKQRGWTQPELAAKTGMKQPRISKMEKPGVTRFTLETLRRLAEAFDCALLVRFASFGELAEWSAQFSPDEFVVPAFEEEIRGNAEPLPLARAEPVAKGVLQSSIQRFGVWRALRAAAA